MLTMLIPGNYVREVAVCSSVPNPSGISIFDIRIIATILSTFLIIRMIITNHLIMTDGRKRERPVSARWPKRAREQEKRIDKRGPWPQFFRFDGVELLLAFLCGGYHYTTLSRETQAMLPDFKTSLPHASLNTALSMATDSELKFKTQTLRNMVNSITRLYMVVLWFVLEWWQLFPCCCLPFPETRWRRPA